MYKCVIIDDEPLAIKVLETYINHVPDLTVTHTFKNPLGALTTLENEVIDILFLDIQMPMLTGLDYLKSNIVKQKVILTTAYREYALEGYELDIVDYLLKPIAFPRFLKAISKFKQTYQHPLDRLEETQKKVVEDHIYVNVNKKFVKIPFHTILFVDSLKDYIRIHTEEKSYVTKEKISFFLLKLPNEFIRVHRSFIVNTKKITAFTAKDIEIGAIEVPIGKSYKEQVTLFLK